MPWMDGLATDYLHCMLLLLTSTGDYSGGHTVLQVCFRFCFIPYSFPTHFINLDLRI